MKDEDYKKAINEALDRAENIWNQVEDKLIKLSENKRIDSSFSSIPSNIPSHEQIDPLKPKVDDFIAFVLDIRNSSDHLLQAYSGGKSQLERVLYEVTAVNTVGSIIISEKKGSITEFLGDGFLALFKVNKVNNDTLYKPHNAAKECMRVIKDIVNPILKKRYNLPELHIGIGLAYSKAIVTAVGHGKNLHPKALGECVFHASKISDGYDVIYFDEHLRLIWPSKKGSNMTFTQRKSSRHDIKFYTLDKKS